MDRDADQMQNPADYVFATPPDLGPGATRAYWEKLLRGLAHKLNNQISVVHGFSSLLLMTGNPAQEMRDNIAHMKEAANQMSSLMNRVLLLGGCGRAAMQRIQLGEFLQMLEKPIGELMQEHGVPFRSNIPAALPLVEADPSRLRELLFELLRNAAEAAGEANGQVRLDVVASGPAGPGNGRRIDIFVRNSGVVLPTEKIPQAFEPFTGNKGSEHFGLGLPTAAMLADLFKGRLGLRTLGETTVAWLQLPAA